MLRLLLLLLCAVFVSTDLKAQGEGNVWTFGYHNGLDFNTSPPTFIQTSNVSIEGCASIADAAGNLLFYSNGNDVWMANGAVMPNGAGILGNGAGFGVLGSCAQGVGIVKALGNPNQYYLFTLDAAEQVNPWNYTGYLRYSLVDMSLNGGDGDVVTGQKNIVLDSAMSEKMTIAKGAGCYYWLLTHRNNSATYRAFKIDATGIRPGISSTGTWDGDMGAGQLKISADGTRIATTTSFAGKGIEIGEFNNATGMVSNTIMFDVLFGVSRIGTAFSPDGSKLYATSFGDLAQYDISAFPNAAAITASKVILSNGSHNSNLRTGPDNKIYVAYYQSHPYIGVIEFPNAAGLACGLNTTALLQPAWSIYPGTSGNARGHGIGNDVVVGLMSDTTVGVTADTLLCFEESWQVSAPTYSTDYLWNDGITTPTRTLTEDGVYHVYSYDNCEVNVDTFKVRFINFDIALGADTALCPNGSLLLDATLVGATYKWQDNTTDPTFNVEQAGTYKVTVTLEGCTSSDTIIVTMLDPYMNIPQQDTLICNDDFISIKAVANPASTYQWSNGSTEAQLTINEAGTYIVTATNACGTFVDSMTLAVENCDCRTFIPTAFSPNQDGNNDVFLIHAACLVSDYTLSVYNRYGQRLFQSSDIAKGWDGNHSSAPVDVGTYFYYIKFKGPRGDAFEQKGDLVLIR